MKNRPRDKKAGIIILAALIIISVAEIIFRATVVGVEVFTTANLGEQLAVIALAVIILISNAKGKDRLCYICYGAWIAYFVLDQFFELPGVIASFVAPLPEGAVITVMTYLPAVIRIVGMVGIIVIGALLVEYMNDGTIYNKAFNITSIITIVALLGLIVCDILIIIIMGMPVDMLLGTFNNLYRLAMVFMFTFFAYDSAKHQLKSVKFSK